MKPDKSIGAGKLRRRAEERLQQQAAPEVAADNSAPDSQRLVHELQVHHIELEMQNEELRDAWAQDEQLKHRFSDFYDFSPVGFVSLDRLGKIKQINLTGARLLGTEREHLSGERFDIYVTAADRPAFNAFVQRVFAEPTRQSCAVDLAAGDQMPRTVQIEAMLSTEEQECRAVVLDITERKQIETRLQLAATVFSHARECIMITDADGTIIDVNQAFTQITGYSREEALGRNPRMLQSGRHGPEFYAAMWREIGSQGYWHGEICDRRKSGDLYTELLTISAVRDTDGRIQNYISVSTDITQLKEHQQQLERVAHYDPLTKLPNRVLLADRLQQAMIQSQRHGHSLALAYLDLDGFKAVNDQYGHEVGDDMLIALAQRLKASMRDGDTLARIGGDEFILLFVDLDVPEEFELVLARLLQAAAAPISIGDIRLQVSASIGVTLYPQDLADPEHLMRHADQAMYLAKQAGKNRFHLFDVARDAAVKTQRESLERIQRALHDQEFVLHYQPKVKIKTGEVIGVEALIHWRHPERGLLNPAAFLPMIEDDAVSVELGEWVIAKALAQLADWHASGLDIGVSVNVGARQLQQADFVTRLSELLAAHPAVEPRYLELEILETSALQDIVQTSSIMQACRAIGVSFALDDFGTGYSSLTYLKRLPAEVLKIDQSFVRDMLTDPDDLAIVAGVIGLAKAFRRKVIAEGVETEAQGVELLKLGCELAQGYHIAQPMPASELAGWAATWRPDAAWTG